MKKRAIAQIRVSDPKQAAADKNGIARQRDQIEQARRLHDLDIVRWVEIQESGKFILQDPQFMQIIADLEAGLADGLVVAEDSRWVRPEQFSGFAVHAIFQDMRKVIWTPTTMIDLNTDDGMLMAGITGLMSGRELGVLKKRMWGARETLRKDGFWGGGGIPKGVIYTKARGKRGGTWSHVPEFIPKMIEAYRMLIEDDAAYDAIARYLDVSERGARLLLENPIWALSVRRRKIERLTAKSRIVERPRVPIKEGEKPRRYTPSRPLVEPEDVKIDLAPIINVDTYEAALRVIAARAASPRYAAKKLPGKHLVPGPMIRCRCGDAYYYKTEKARNIADRLACYSKHPAKKRRTKASRNLPRPVPCNSAGFYRVNLEEGVERMFTEALTLELLAEILGGIGKADRKAPAKRRSIDAELVALERQFSRGLRQYMEEKIPERAWDEQRTRIETKRRELLADRPEKVTAIENPDTLAEAIVAVFRAFPALLFAEKQALIRDCIKEIHVSMEAEILGLKISGGFLHGLQAKVVTSGRRFQTSSESNHNTPPADLLIRLPQPIALKAAA